jgi:hypothetical protein
MLQSQYGKYALWSNNNKRYPMFTSNILDEVKKELITQDDICRETSNYDLKLMITEFHGEWKNPLFVDGIDEIQI